MLGSAESRAPLMAAAAGKREAEVASTSRGGFELKFNEPRDPGSFHVAGISPRRDTRSDMRVPFNYVSSLTLVGASWYRDVPASRDVSMTLRKPVARRGRFRLDDRAHRAPYRLISSNIFFPLFCFSERTERQQTEDGLGELDLQHLPGRPVPG